MFSDSFDSEGPDLTIDHLRSGQIVDWFSCFRRCRVSYNGIKHYKAANNSRIFDKIKNGPTLAIWPILHNEFNLFLQRPDKPKQRYMLDIL